MSIASIVGGAKQRRTIWAVIAAALGLAAGVLPLSALIAAAGVIGISLIGLAQPIALLITTLIVAPLKALIDTESATPFDPGQIAFGLTVAVWLINRIATRRRLVYASSVYVPLCLILIGASFSLFAALSPLTTLIELSKWVEMLVTAGLVVALCAEQGWGWIVAGLLAASTAQAILGIWQFFGGSGSPSLWIIENRFFRAFGTFGQPNPFGAFIGLTLPLALGLLYGALSERLARAPSLNPSPSPAFPSVGEGASPEGAGLQAPRHTLLRRGVRGEGFRWIALGGCALLLGGALITSWSRGAWLGFGAALLVMLAFAPRKRWRGLLLVGGLLLIGLLTAVSGLLPASLTTRLGDFSGELGGFQDVRGQVITDANYGVLERLAHWQAGLAMGDAHPWLGVGFGNYELAYPQYQAMNWKFPLGHAHNYYINMLAETGLVGLIAYLVAWLIIFTLTIWLLGLTHGIERGLVLGLLGVWTHLAVHSVFDKLYVDNLYLHIGAMLGLIGGLSVIVQQNRDRHVAN